MSLLMHQMTGSFQRAYMAEIVRCGFLRKLCWVLVACVPCAPWASHRLPGTSMRAMQLFSVWNAAGNLLHWACSLTRLVKWSLQIRSSLRIHPYPRATTLSLTISSTNTLVLTGDNLD